MSEIIREPSIHIDIKDVYITVQNMEKILLRIDTELSIGKYNERLDALEKDNWKQKGFAAAIGAGISLFVDKLHFR